jgi:hypothetical protein
MISISAVQWSKIWNELPNPNSSRFEIESPYYDVSFIDEDCVITNIAVYSRTNEMTILAPCKKIRFKLNMGMNGRCWEPEESIIIKPAKIII